MKVYFIFTVLVLTGCSGKHWKEYEKPIQKGIIKFSNESELKEHIDVAKKYQEVALSNLPKPKKNKFRGYGQLEEVIVTAQKLADTGSITNNQEVGVDEGDIVKKIGDFLIVLRKGMIFSAYIGSRNGNGLELRAKLNIQDSMKSHDSWYDELLVSQDHVIVVGYSYELDASELVFFKLDNYGKLSYQWTYFLPSDDYFDSENYATRIVDGNLVLVAPTYESWSDIEKRLNAGELSKLIAQRHNIGSTELEQVNIVSQRDYYKASAHLRKSFRTQNIIKCPLDNILINGLQCDVVSLLGAVGAFYVSPNAVYIWASDQAVGFDYSQISLRDYGQLSRHGVLQKWASDQSENIIYRIDFKSGDVVGVGVQGSPINQFSFQERDDQFLGVTSYLVDRADKTELEVYGVSIPLSTFGSLIPEVPENQYTFLAVADSHLSANRFLGSNAFVSGARYSEDKITTDVIVWNTDTNNVSAFNSNYAIRAFHPLGDQMLAMGRDENERLIMESWKVDPEPESLLLKHFENRISAESRSHGFNSAEVNGDLLFGVPVSHILNKEAEEKFWDESLATDLVFFNYRQNGSFEEVGTVFGSAFQQDETECQVSCYDWYGSARPFFINNSIYALMDYELVRTSYNSILSNRMQRLNLQTGTVIFE